MTIDLCSARGNTDRRYGSARTITTLNRMIDLVPWNASAASNPHIGFDVALSATQLKEDTNTLASSTRKSTIACDPFQSSIFRPTATPSLDSGFESFLIFRSMRAYVGGTVDAFSAPIAPGPGRTCALVTSLSRARRCSSLQVASSRARAGLTPGAGGVARVVVCGAATVDHFCIGIYITECS